MEFEERIREQRASEALQKNLSGQEGKIFLISKILGETIYKENYEAEYLNFEDTFDDENTLPTFSDDSGSIVVGHFYDDLRRGNHLEINFSEYNSAIKLFYRGYLQYHEENGVLLTYVPNNNWEKIVDDLFKMVEEKVKNLMIKRKIAEHEAFPAIKEQEINRLRSKWGDFI